MREGIGRMMERQLDNHILVLGYSDLIEAFIEEVGIRKDILIVSADRDLIAELDDRGIQALRANPNDEKSLSIAGIDRARIAIIGSDNDAADAVTILNVRQLNPDAHIYAVATKPGNVEKLQLVGADSVFCPSIIAADRISKAVMEK